MTWYNNYCHSAGSSTVSRIVESLMALAGFTPAGPAADLAAALQSAIAIASGGQEAPSPPYRQLR